MYRIWRTLRGTRASASPNWTKLFFIAVFFIFTCYGWLLFRAHSFDQIAYMTTLLFVDVGNFNYSGASPRLSAVAGLPIARHSRIDRIYLRQNTLL